MRMHGHSEHDPAKYVPRALLDEWKKKDPILKAEQMLEATRLCRRDALP